MTAQEKKQILKLAEKAEDLFLQHRNVCQELEHELDKYSKLEVLEVLYQMSDGLVVETPHIGWESSCPENIPIKLFVEGYVK